MDPDIVGAWTSTEAFGNTALDWSEDVKAGKAVLHLNFSEDGSVLFDVSGPRSYVHVLPSVTFHCTAKNGLLTIPEDASGLVWNYHVEDQSTLQIRLVGAKRFARCKGVDTIYLTRR
ncbi:hypothetical protein H310_05436 [Aphanomyces invadans]|uniref:Uncharacterized protein n=1 Tax=Aphanomyces invadans TaxID=157072 RepID=A0A024U9X2_9STRA|nr:hypothetical protein H310_05436 [Aphanomyces invadans]ETW03000.1 hypothetical protein H310_05436 [Aphanomyces invadans]|eukprot:XP_008868384.1 hypothetical protein H310_05436 [Aphanomyces invadans]